MKKEPEPNQGATSGDPVEIECPTCGRENDISGDGDIHEREVYDCYHCGAKFEIEAVDYDVTVYTKAVPPKEKT